MTVQFLEIILVQRRIILVQGRLHNIDKCIELKMTGRQFDSFYIPASKITTMVATKNIGRKKTSPPKKSLERF